MHTATIVRRGPHPLMQIKRLRLGGIVAAGQGTRAGHGGEKKPIRTARTSATRPSLAAYTRTKGIAPARFAEIVREYVRDHGSITNRECRELLGLRDSASAQVEASRYLKKWSTSTSFLKAEGTPPRVRYRLRTNLLGDVLSKLRGQ